jgi:hypothetical protein
MHVYVTAYYGCVTFSGEVLTERALGWGFLVRRTHLQHSQQEGDPVYAMRRVFNNELLSTAPLINWSMPCCGIVAEGTIAPTTALNEHYNKKQHPT